jgi:hypothetical protein
MQTELDRLLAKISPERAIAETFNRANQAINTFRVKSARIEDRGEFECCMGEFLRHIDHYVLRLCRPVEASSDSCWSLCARVLMKVYGPSGEKAAFEMSRTGSGGGLYAVLRAVAMHVAEEYAKREIQAKVNAYLDGLTVEKQLEASSEYIAKYGHFLPSEMTEASAARIHAEFGKVLQRHPWLILKIHDVGR